MKNVYLGLISLLILTACSTPEKKTISVSSPDEKTELRFHTTDTSIYYEVLFENEAVIAASGLGFEFKNENALCKDFRIINHKITQTNESWEQVWGQNKKIENNYKETYIQLEEKTKAKRKLNLRFKVYNDGLGFRYEIPEQTGIDSLFITNEKTEFNLTQDYSTWFIPANYSSYEALYQNKACSDVRSANTPITFESKEESLFLSIHEANLTNYAGMTLKKQKEGSLDFAVDLVPWPDGVKVKTTLPMQTPWRTIQISKSAQELAESSLILNLNEENVLEDVSWIQPAKYIGIWWGMHLGTQSWTLGERHGATTENMKIYIDFAAENGIEAVLAEGWSTGWEEWGQAKAFDFVTAYPDFDLPEIVKYAKTKGVEIIGHHETGGDAPYYEEQLEKAFQLYHDLGIRYVKTGYAGPIQPRGFYHHGQAMVNHYRKVVELAAKYEIMLDVHEPIKPTGLRRTYPNMMTREGARGMEWNGWSDGNPPEHHVILPFTRLLAGPMDYNPGIFDLLYKNAENRVKWNDLDKGQSRTNTTLAKQLALFVTMYSPMQMAADLVENYQNHPAFQFISDVSADWQTTKVLNGKIGDFYTVVRKDINSEDWYLGSITDESKRDFKLALDFLESNTEYEAQIYKDTKDSHWKTNPYAYEISTATFISSDSLTIHLAEGGGQAIRFTPKQ